MPMLEGGSDSNSTFATLTEGNSTIGGKRTTAVEAVGRCCAGREVSRCAELLEFCTHDPGSV